jgi:hypothetical protein
VSLRNIARKIPGAARAYRALRQVAARAASTEQIFTDIFRGNKFGGTLSVSGRGSDLEQTRVLIRDLPMLFRDYQVRSILDIPCGDFFWMQHVALEGIEYVGADIVGELVQKNRAKYQRDGIRFERLDLARDELPSADLVLCRDCLVHLSFAEVRRALRNVCASGARLLLTTTFPSRQTNGDIPGGGWRTLNLQRAPFDLPPPLQLINEGCTEGDGAYADKSLGLWRIQDVAEALKK